MDIQRDPALRGFWDLKKTALCEFRVSGTVWSPLLIRKSPSSGSGICGSENRVSGGPLYIYFFK
jgi:hypothetical protein